MSTNRTSINDFDLKRPAQLLDKGLPLPGLSGKYVVDEGWVAIITEGGGYKETLKPGTHFLNKYRFFRDVKAIAVNTKIQTMTVSTKNEFTIQHPVRVKIALDLSVEYQVVDARRVALEINEPLTGLWDRVFQSVKGAVVHETVDAIYTQGESIAQVTLQRLQSMRLPKVLGIEVFNVMVLTIEPTDAGRDILAQQSLSEYQTVRNFQLEQGMLANTQITWEWIMLNRPDYAKELLATYGSMAKEMIDKGLLDPAGFLQDPIGGQSNLNNPMNNLLGGFMPGGGQSGTASSAAGSAPTQLPRPSAPDPFERVKEDKRLLEARLPGIRVQARGGVDEATNTPNGTFFFDIRFPRNSGGEIHLEIYCPKGYPTPPAVPQPITLDVDGQHRPFESEVLRRWQASNYLVDYAEEVRRFLG